MARVKSATKAVKEPAKKAVKVTVRKAASKVKPKAKPAKPVKPKKAKKNPNGSYTLHMHDKLQWLHEQAKARGMQTSVFVRQAIDKFIATPVE